MAAYHRHKEINAAIALVVENGWSWTPRTGKGHAVGILRCVLGHGEHTMTVNGSPANPEAHARAIRRLLTRCPK